jgi:hypothetical protein
MQKSHAAANAQAICSASIGFMPDSAISCAILTILADALTKTAQNFSHSDIAVFFAWYGLRLFF